MKVVKIALMALVLGFVGCQEDEVIVLNGDKSCDTEVTYTVIKPIVGSIESTPNDGPWNWYVQGQDTLTQEVMDICKCRGIQTEALDIWDKYVSTFGNLNQLDKQEWYENNPTTFECVEF